MSQIPAPPETPQDEENIERTSLRDMLPPWLTSLVTHLTLVLLLALLTVGGAGGGNGTVALECQLGDAGSEFVDGQLDAAMLSASDLPNASSSAQEFAAPDAQLLADSTSQPQLEMADLTGSRDGQGDNDSGGKGPLGNGDGDQEGAAAPGSGGKGLVPVRTEIFGLSAEGTRFVYVFDRSDSMNSVLTYTVEGSARSTITPLDAAKAELIRSLEDLDARQQFQIIFYNHAPLVFNGGSVRTKLLRGTPENKYRAVKFVNQVKGEGNTHHMEPLEVALSMRPDVVFLLTDGEPKDELWDEQLVELKKQNKSRARIHVIQFGFQPNPNSSLERLANETGGKHIFFNISRLAPGLPDGPRQHGGDGTSLRVTPQPKDVP
jgi:hypothetical protein